ncbi:MAG: response regulator transcription factor [Firmicutes bacterium]|nr:response regulator transcription factor [Bacillota bacterium]
MYNIIICEDNEQDIELLEKNIIRFFSEHDLTCNINVFRSGESLLNHSSVYSWDIVFFDVEMGKINGIEAAKQLRKADKSVKIVFVTSHPGYVFNSFIAEPLNFLIKPVNYPMLSEILEQALMRIDDEKGDVFTISFDNVVSNIPLSQIIYFESNLRIINIVTTDQTFKFYGKLDDIERELEGKDFIRCHKSYIVNLRHINMIDGDAIYMSNNSVISISRANKKKVKELVMDYVGKTVL